MTPITATGAADAPSSSAGSSTAEWRANTDHVEDSARHPTRLETQRIAGVDCNRCRDGIARHGGSSGGEGRPSGVPCLALPFETTRWSLVLAAAGTDSQAREALSSLCQTYWYPLYAYLRRRSRPGDARDLTQGFLTSLIERQDFEGLRQDRGRFRAFLLASLKHYLSNWSARERTQKRGGGWQMVPLENAEGLYVVEPVNHATPETLFEHESPGTDMEANCSRRRRGLLERPAPPLAQGRSDERASGSAARTIFRNFDRRRERRCTSSVRTSRLSAVRMRTSTARFAAAANMSTSCLLPSVGVEYNSPAATPGLVR